MASMSLRHAFKLLRRLLAWTRLVRLVRNRLLVGTLVTLGAVGAALVMRSRRKPEIEPADLRVPPNPMPRIAPASTPMLTPAPTPDPAPMLTPAPTPDPAPKLAPPSTPDPAPMLNRAPTPALDTSSELQRIKGLGPKSAAALNRASMSSLERLSTASVEELNRALEAAGVKAPASLPTWPARASELLGKSSPEA